MAIGTLAAFWAVSFLLVLVPGADWAYAIAAGLRDRSVLPAVAGLLAGYAGLTAVVAAGVATVIARSPLALTVLTTFGAVYLLWLGITTVTRPPAPRAAADHASRPWARTLPPSSRTCPLARCCSPGTAAPRSRRRRRPSWQRRSRPWQFSARLTGSAPGS